MRLLVLCFGAGVGDFIELNASGAQGEFQPAFQEKNLTDDQGHHFAAFFQLGFTYGGNNASSAASAWEAYEGTPGNRGDINSGMVAGTVGANVASDVLPVDEVGKTIRENLCK